MVISTAKMLLFASVLAGFSALNSTSSLASECFEEQFVPAHMECDGNNTNSADFVIGCRSVPDETVQTSVDCPVGTAQWFNAPSAVLIGDYASNAIPGPSESHTAFCSKVSKVPGNIAGQTCASGRYRPITGGGHAEIIYPFGTIGEESEGGYFFKTLGGLTWAPGGAPIAPRTYYCSNNISSTDLNSNGTGPLEYVVAMVCE